jgi:hypothetical protein|tara:strand:+ start:1033 stop:1224 length:192 start_codon:yes stop_codon:yes gene_type:complete
MKFHKKYLQGRKIKKIKKAIANIDWNMQFDEPSEHDIKKLNSRLDSLTMLLRIEEGLYESYCR